jgi:hypothetical protein
MNYYGSSTHYRMSLGTVQGMLPQEQGAKEGTPFIAKHIIHTTDVAFDDFAGGQTDMERNRKILGLN